MAETANRRPARRNGENGDEAAERQLDQTGLTHLVGYAATRASVQLKKTLARHLGPLDLKAVEYSVLVIVANNRDVNQKQLCRELDVSPPNLAVVLDRLEARGVLVRRRSSADRRESIVTLTPAGRVLHARAVEVAATMENEATCVLTEAERLLLIELLHRIARGVPRQP
jgi:DNA-binding MarR family transcriptional regulator